MKQHVAKWMGLIACASLLGCIFSGCAWQLGSDKTGTTTVRPTRGQELLDLKKAKDQGAISEDEYQAQRKKVLER